jgi:sulfite exporter TauE/SafE
MCGPIVSAFSVAQRRREGPPPLWPPLARYHLGRILSYVVIGGALGLVGAMSRLSSSAQAVQGGISIGAGVLVLALGLGLLGILPAQRWVESRAMGRRVSRWIGSLLGGESWRRQLTLGIANGFLPCGPVVAVALAAAAAANPLHSMGAMAVYGLGTVPVLVVIGLGIHRLSALARARYFRLGSVLVLLIAVQLGLRGMAQVGVVGHVRVGDLVLW